MRPFLRFAFAWIVLQSIVKADQPAIVFDRDIRPILADKCFACHGPDEETREAGLRLDIRDGAIQPAESGKAALVPGKPDESSLVRKIFSTRDSVVMPPPKSNKTLNDREKAAIRQWIADGAEYQEHWAFVPPKKSNPPKTDSSWPRNPIDTFLLAKMKTAGLSPSPEADRTTLIRRATLDLTGLPPTIAEIDAFLNDASPDAYEKRVDGLLANPCYGERMALDWLDASRFADTHGYHIDAGRDMSRWRAWVIDSYNANKPFDAFAVEQIAGDLLPSATLDQKIASGFNRNHMINFEGGAVPEEYHTAYVIDRVNTTGTVWLGLTVGCAQCHDHKFDPIKQKDYYGLYAFFHNVPENGLDGSKGNAPPLIAAPSADQQADLDRMASEVSAMESRIAMPDAKADADQAAWETSSAASASWRFPSVREALSAGKATMKVLDDATIIIDGENAATDSYRVAIKNDGGDVTAVRVEMLPDDRYPNRGPGRSVNGNIVLTNVRLETLGEPQSPLKIASASADFSQDNFAASLAIDGDAKSGWAISPEFGKPHEIVLVLAEKTSAPELQITLDFHSPFASHQPARFRISTTSSANPAEINTRPVPVKEAIAIAGSKRTDAQRAAIRSYYRATIDANYRGLASEIAAVRKLRSNLEARVPTAMIMAEMATPRDTFILMRGQYDKKGEKVEANVPSFLPALADDLPKNRLGLARWLVRPDHPLTSRVAVNRLWQSFFGTGLVKTSEDFGTQGEQPSHPELLDWLAVDFVKPEDGRAWDVKRLVRMIVTSSAYRQSSVVSRESLAIDPENRMLSRAPRLRLPAEVLRDQALYTSGLLKEKLGGSSVSPYNPPGLWEELMSRSDGANWSAQTYVQNHGDDLYRRTMYTFWKRTCPPPSLATFDAPDRETCTVRRARTNTPLQALVMLNDPTYVEASRKLAERMIREGGDTSETRIALAFRLATSRAPRPEERAILSEIYQTELTKFRSHPDHALKLLSVGEAKRDETLDPAEVAAMSTVAGVILNLDEVVTKG